jgi:hypothetical protein
VAKNGWLPLSSEGVLQEISSIGGDRPRRPAVLIAMLSSGNPSESDDSQVSRPPRRPLSPVSGVTSFQRPQGRQYQESRIRQ